MTETRRTDRNGRTRRNEEEELKTAREGCYTSRVKGAAPSEGPPASSGWDAQLGTLMSPMEAERTARCVLLRLSRLKHGPTWDLRAYTPLHVRVWRGSASRNEVSSFVKGALSRRYVCNLLYSSLFHTGF
ncbi:hypothetical protein ACOMHN_006280 [Nucella lapillus]